MDLQSYLRAATKEYRENEVDQSGQMLLGELVNAVHAIPDADAVVTIDGVHTPKHVQSYRGYYNELAIEYEDNPSGIRAEALLDLLAGAIGSTHQGYKGGDYTMHRSTPVWVSHYSTCEGRAVVGVANVAGSWRIVTRNTDE